MRLTLRVPFGECANLTAAVGDSALAEIVRSQLDRYRIARHYANEVFAHFASDVGYYSMAIFELNTKLSTRKGLNYSTRQLDHFLIDSHKYNKLSL